MVIHASYGYNNLKLDEKFPNVFVILALDSLNYCYEEQVKQPNIYKITQSSLYNWTMYINQNKTK